MMSSIGMFSENGKEYVIRTAELKRLRSIEELYGKHALGVIYHAGEFCCSI